MRIAVLILAAVALLLAAGTVYWMGVVIPRREAQYDVVFGSSDGGFRDATSNLKGRKFDTVLWNFEHYKMVTNQPDVTLVRLTGPVRTRPGMLEIAVPTGSRPPGSRPMNIPSPSPSLHAELDRRTRAAMKYWEEKAKRGGGDSRKD